MVDADAEVSRFESGFSMGAFLLPNLWYLFHGIWGLAALFPALMIVLGVAVTNLEDCVDLRWLRLAVLVIWSGFSAIFATRARSMAGARNRTRPVRVRRLWEWFWLVLGIVLLLLVSLQAV